MMVCLDQNAYFPHLLNHLTTQIVIGVGGAYGEITALKTRFITQVRLFEASGVPCPLDRIYLIHSRMLILLVADLIEYKEFRLRPYITNVGNTGFLQISRSLACDMPRVASVIFLSDGVHDICYYTDGRLFEEGVNHSSIRIGYS